eukprot:CAMPEP_0204520710 /NCGR_PEP_ID=MMETSP0661-20131031/5404_1 /ASSEMBLY_ACC=CAM_ASM_000606 /TAXON_ID=109239 /ORGANISM="Alexandrium margalefi, Strain AMGDE01CS-322" /LENGTH=291 /DNA_ID=CAMNT_0051526277 /DNA_START=42 /DNA_END=917 /DNA_ORIENTATION=+
MGAACLVASVHDLLLHELSARAGRPFAGLSQATRWHRGFPAAVCQKVMRLDIAYPVTRHIMQPGSQAFVQEVLAVAPPAPPACVEAPSVQLHVVPALRWIATTSLRRDGHLPASGALPPVGACGRSARAHGRRVRLLRFWVRHRRRRAHRHGHGSKRRADRRTCRPLRAPARPCNVCEKLFADFAHLNALVSQACAAFAATPAAVLDGLRADSDNVKDKTKDKAGIHGSRNEAHCCAGRDGSKASDTIDKVRRVAAVSPDSAKAETQNRDGIPPDQQRLRKMSRRARVIFG